MTELLTLTKFVRNFKTNNMQTLIIINLIIISILFIFIIRINRGYKSKIYAVTNKVNYINLRVGFMLKTIEEYKKDTNFRNEDRKNMILNKYDELDEIIVKYLELV